MKKCKEVKKSPVRKPVKRDDGIAAGMKLAPRPKVMKM